MAPKKKKAAKRKADKKAKRAKPAKSVSRFAPKPKGRWTAPGAKKRAAAAKAATTAPKQEALIKGLRIGSLDNVCGHISDTRAAIARLQGEEADLERQAHSLMKKHKQMTWQSAGVVLARIEGEEKLRVTTVRARGPAPTAQPEDPTPIDEQAPVSQTEERTAAIEDVERETVEA